MNTGKPINPGYGYRLIDPDRDKWQDGDEFYTGGAWCPSGRLFNDNQNG